MFSSVKFKSTMKNNNKDTTNSRVNSFIIITLTSQHQHHNINNNKTINIYINTTCTSTTRVNEWDNARQRLKLDLTKIIWQCVFFQNRCRSSVVVCYALRCLREGQPIFRDWNSDKYIHLRQNKRISGRNISFYYV